MRLETPNCIAEHAREIYIQSGRSHAMPPGNVSHDDRRGARADRRLVSIGDRGAEPVTAKILRGRVLTFVAEPQGPDDQASYRYIEDGAVVVDGGKIVSVGE